MHAVASTYLCAPYYFLSLARWALHECTQATTPTLPLHRSWLLPACPRLLLRSRPVSVCVPAARPRLRDARSDGKQAPRWRRRRQARRRSRACWSRQSPNAACPCMHTPRARYLMAAVSGPRVYSSSLPAGHSILTVCLDFFLLTGPGPGPANGKWRGATTLGLE